jgi:ATP-dependent helicase HrpB
VAALFGEDIDTHETVVWSGDRLMRRRERRLGGITLDVAEFRPEPTTETTSMVLARAGAGGGLPWTDQARRVYHRVAFLRSHRGEPWPDWGDPSTPVREYLASTGSHLTGLDDLERLDLERALFAALDPGRRSELDREAPERLRLSNGKTVTIEYGSGAPVVAIRVQEVLGVVDAHQVAGVPVTFQLLSPAGRPLQITSDLAGFWEGSWQVVRKEMAGRYPKHAWPENPGRR